MSTRYEPKYSITPEMANDLLRIEAVRGKIIDMPLSPVVLRSLRESARLESVHYSTKIEGNRLSTQQVEQVLKQGGHFPNKERDEQEVLGYYAAQSQVETWAKRGGSITESMIKTIHALVMGGGRTDVGESPYRDGQSALRNVATGAIVYMPPQAKDVPGLMHALVSWITESTHVPCPIVAGIAHFQFAAIHPYYDGNGRTARLLTMLILYLGGYDLKGIYSLEKYYAHDLSSYYRAIGLRPSVSYSKERDNIDITPWVAYFLKGVATSCEKVLEHLKREQMKRVPDHTRSLRMLDPTQRKLLDLFHSFEVVTTGQIAEYLGLSQRTVARLCKKWVTQGFLEVTDPAKRSRSYRLSEQFDSLIG